MIQASHSIVVFRVLQLGDMLCAVPALRALRGHFPTSKITLVGLPWARDFSRRFSAYVDEFVEFPGFPGLVERPYQLVSIHNFFAQMQVRAFDLAVQMHGSGEISNICVALMGAHRSVGFYQKGAWCPEVGNYRLYPDPSVHEIDRNLILLESLGIHGPSRSLEFPLKPTEVSWGKNLISKMGLGVGKYVCLHPGARDPSRRWSPEHFAEIGDYLVQKGFQVLITGSYSEREIAHQVSQVMREKSIDSTVLDLPIGMLAALLFYSCCVVSNDTGIAHLAAALHLPSVVVFLKPELVSRWAPLDRTMHRVVIQGDVEKVKEELESALVHSMHATRVI